MHHILANFIWREHVVYICHSGPCVCRVILSGGLWWIWSFLNVVSYIQRTSCYAWCCDPISPCWYCYKSIIWPKTAWDAARLTTAFAPPMARIQWHLVRCCQLGTKQICRNSAQQCSIHRDLSCPSKWLPVAVLCLMEVNHCMWSLKWETAQTCIVNELVAVRVPFIIFGGDTHNTMSHDRKNTSVFAAMLREIKHCSPTL